MPLKQEISAAIGAHGQWKVWLKAAIETGRIDATMEKVKSDRECIFGKWLQASAENPAVRNSSHYIRCRELHAEFHQSAARVVHLLHAGKKAEAEAMIAMQGEFSRVSATLTRAMMEWAASLPDGA